MFYGRESIEDQFSQVLKKLEQQELFLFEPMPSYKLNERWTDEFRIRDGHTKLADGTWVTIHKVTTYLEAIQKSTIELYELNKQLYKDLDLARQSNREMEYGLRVAAKSLNNSLKLKQDIINDSNT
jgi:hypothetical protein